MQMSLVQWALISLTNDGVGYASKNCAMTRCLVACDETRLIKQQDTCEYTRQGAGGGFDAVVCVRYDLGMHTRSRERACPYQQSPRAVGVILLQQIHRGGWWRGCHPR